MVSAMSAQAASIARSPAAFERWYSDGPSALAPARADMHQSRHAGGAGRR